MTNYQCILQGIVFLVFVGLSSSDPCNSSPCGVNGQCFSTENGGFKCLCNASYTGRTCDTGPKEDGCDSDPCVNGECIPIGQSKDVGSCKCEQGWTGRNCSIPESSRSTSTSHTTARPPATTGINDTIRTTTTSSFPKTTVARTSHTLTPSATTDIDHSVIDDTSLPHIYIVAILIFFILVLLFFIIGIVFYRRGKSGTTPSGLDETQIQDLQSVSVVPHQRISINFFAEDEAGEYVNFKDGSIDPSYWEIPWINLHLEGIQLGHGHFGVVQAGNVKVGNTWIPVALKTLPENASEDSKRNFNNELELMMKMGRHKNIASLVGACVNGGIKYMILEYANLGDLRNVLRDSRLCDVSGPRSTLGSEQLINLALDVARGMQFLAENDIIHRDLAARNVLVHRDVGESLVAKVCDFGLSREDADYTQISQYPVPIRWMAIESLTTRTFSTQSDVWSYGVLLWEIFSLGASPYSWPEKVEQRDILLYLQDNNRMEKPENCDHEMYNLMLRCWRRVPDDRPSFSDITTDLSNMIENEDEDLYVITAINQGYID